MKLLRHSFYNLLGLGLPMVAAVFTIPPLISGLGEARFGLLTIIWALVSYFGLFDLGLGRALTQQVAQAEANQEIGLIGPLVTTALGFMTALGVALGVVFALFAPVSITYMDTNTGTTEAAWAALAMAIALPAIILTSGFRGILEAKRAFGAINLIRLPMGLYTFLGPYAAVVLGYSRLDIIALVLAIGRIVAALIHGWLVWRMLRPANLRYYFDVKLLQPLYVSGGWMTIANLASSIMSYADRFLIALVVSTAAVSFYVTPMELVTKLWIVPAALTATLFPALTVSIAGDKTSASQIFQRTLLSLYVTMLPPTLFCFMFSHEILTLWINADFAAHSSHLLQIFAIGTLVSAIAQIPFTTLQSSGNSKQTALIQLFELPIYLSLLYWFTDTQGIQGTALIWLSRIILDAIALYHVTTRRVFTSKIVGSLRLWMLLVLCFAATFITFASASLASSYFTKIFLATVVSITCLAGFRKLTKASFDFVSRPHSNKMIQQTDPQ